MTEVEDSKNANNSLQNENDPKKQDDFLGNYLSTKGYENSHPHINPVSFEELSAKIKKADHEAINKMLLETLGPELKNNETQKRILKCKLMNYIIIILSVQLGFFLLIALVLTIATCVNPSGFEKIANSIFDFLKYYASAVLVEFITMLFFIVKFVFDKSIVTLISKLFDKGDK